MLRIIGRTRIIAITVFASDSTVRSLNDYFRVLVLGNVTCDCRSFGLGIADAGVAVITFTMNCPFAIRSRRNPLILTWHNITSFPR